MPRNQFKAKAFTLAELLIALAILGVIATFTIPKVLTAQQEGKYKAMAKEVAALFSDSYQQHRLKGLVSSSTSSAHLTPYLNYIKVFTSSEPIDSKPGQPTITCENWRPCLLLHNGGMLIFETGNNFSGTASTNGIWMMFDPDGKASSNSNGLAVQFWLLYNGQLVTDGNRSISITDSYGTWGSGCPTCDPAWFGWN